MIFDKVMICPICNKESLLQKTLYLQNNEGKVIEMIMLLCARVECGHNDKTSRRVDLTFEEAKDKWRKEYADTQIDYYDFIRRNHENN